MPKAQAAKYPGREPQVARPNGRLSGRAGPVNHYPWPVAQPGHAPQGNTGTSLPGTTELLPATTSLGPTEDSGKGRWVCMEMVVVREQGGMFVHALFLQVVCAVAWSRVILLP